MTIEYTEIGDYYFPNIKVNEQTKAELLKYGRKKLRYIQRYQKGFYTDLLTSDGLYKYLEKVDREANDLYERLLIDFKKKRNITEELKEQNQMQWVREMNNIQNCIDEIVRKEVIYNKLRNELPIFMVRSFFYSLV